MYEKWLVYEFMKCMKSGFFSKIYEIYEKWFVCEFIKCMRSDLFMNL